MEYTHIHSLAEKLREKNIPEKVLESFEEAFSIEYTHHSTAMEGNTLTLIETKAVIEDEISVGGKKLREIYEVANHNKAFNYAKKRISQGDPLDEKITKDIHAIVMENIDIGGVYRHEDVAIRGAAHTPPSPNEMYNQIKYFYTQLDRDDLNPIELAAWVHAEFVRIHPFTDGNGRTARLIMNYSLMSGGFLPVNISTDVRIAYYESLDIYGVKRELAPFAELIAELETKRLEHYLSIEY
ncbi:MAG: Fic family protein [Muribaculaceae bacterium]|nr:Fic family protein [Muribaculaceae bacterium]